MYPKLSYWEKESFFKGIDVAIVGSGIVGLNAAIHLKELNPNLKIAIFERGSLPAGASTRNAGFACFGSISELLDDLQSQSETEVFDLVEKRWAGLRRLRERLGDKQLQFQELGGYEVFKEGEEEIFLNCKNQIADFNEILSKITGRKQVYQIADKQIANFKFNGVRHMILNNAEGQIHTGQMMLGLLQIARQKGVSIFSGFSIEGFESTQHGLTIIAGNGIGIDCSKLIIATNGFAKQLIPSIDVQPARNQVLITKPLKSLNLKGCFHYDRGYFYFRNIGNRVLLGGGRNLAPQDEFTHEFGTTEVIQTALADLLKNVILPGQDFEIDSWWSGILGLGHQKKVIVKKQSEHVILAVRLGGMGVAIGSLIGEEAAKLAYGN